MFAIKDRFENVYYTALNTATRSVAYVSVMSTLGGHYKFGKAVCKVALSLNELRREEDRYIEE